MGHKSFHILEKELKQARKKIETGSKYYHYKHPDQFYTILGVGFIESTEEACVIYQAEYGEK